MKTKALLLSCCFLLFLPSCSNLKKTQALNMLFQNTWVVESLLGNKLDISKFTRGLPSLNFGRDGNMSGFTGCNQMHGSFEADKKGLKFGNIASTKMYCEEVDEDSFTHALGKVTNFQKDGNNLNLLGGKDVLMTLIPQ